jgi:endonuclease/exonuclease/phosphatase family metal-dependent hydrolase
MKFLTYNIQYGLGLDEKFDLNRIAKAISDANADVIALQEVECYWQRTGMVHQPRELAAQLPGYHWVYGANLDMNADVEDENGNPVQRRRQFGTMVLSKTPIISSRNFPLPKYGAMAQHSIQQGALEAVIDTRSGPIRVYSIHLSHLVSETRQPQVNAILNIHRRAPSEGGAWCGGHPGPDEGWTEGEMPPMPHEAILMGDFNFLYSSPEYDAIIGPMTPKYGRLANRDGFVDAWVTAGNGEDEGNSVWDGGRIDYCFVSSPLAGRIRDCRIDNEADASDHFPIVTEIDL